MPGSSGGSGDGPDHAVVVTEETLEARLEERLEDVITEEEEEELAEFRADMEAAMTAVVEDVLPEIVKDVARQMAAGPFSPAAAAGPSAVHTDYSHLVAEAFEAAETE